MRNKGNLINLTFGPLNLPKKKTERERQAVGNLKIISWNIENHGNRITGSKMLDPEFTSILSSHTICMLQETKKLQEGLKGYTCYKKSRKDDKVDGRSGGVCTFVRDGIKQELFYRGTSDIIAVKMGKEDTNLGKSVVLINFYVSPPQSSYSKHANEYEPYEELSRLVSSIGQRYHIIIGGDFNARTALLDDRVQRSSIDNVLNLPSFLSSPPIAARANEDTGTNQLTSTLIEMLHTTGLVIANGRVSGDTTGKITCMKWNGVSTVDYIIVDPPLLQRTKNMKVFDLTDFSDHRPLSLTIKSKAENPLKTTQCHTTMIEKCPNKFKWDEEGKRRFKESLKARSDSETPSLILQSEETLSRERCEMLCDAVTNVFTTAADKSLVRARDPPNKGGGIKPWYDGQCGALKKIQDTARLFSSNHPFDELARKKFHDAKREYRRVRRIKKSSYEKGLNEELEADGNINWKVLKKLKKANTQEANDMCPQEFYHFFKDLYGRDVEVEDHRRDLIGVKLRANLELINSQTYDREEFEITQDELNNVIKSCKSGKAAGDDEITNDMLKCSDTKLREVIVATFNCCIKTKCFPWKESIIIPIHKKGPTSDPDKYRPIALSSCLGKLYAQLILNKVQAERRDKCPEAINQAGFCKGAMTVDHILTIQTIVQKYKKLKKPVYGAFIDFAKAFDTVWRDALLVKLAEMGLNATLMRTIVEYYRERTACLKMKQGKTDSFPTKKGVIQGEPPSPELFKGYIYDLSPLLDEAKDLPELAKLAISHLLWADDLFLNSLSPEGLQQLLDILFKYCKDWGLSPNPSKCNVVIFNQKKEDEGRQFKLGKDVIEITSSYTYLGLELTKDGEVKQAADTLSKKGKKAIGSLMGTIDRRVIKPAMAIKLFNCLVKPILLYGSQIWTPLLATKQILGLAPLNLSTYFRNHAGLGGERVHLRFLKWVLGVNKKATNVFCWGELGEFPLIYSALEQALSFFKRVTVAPKGSLLYHTVKEQKQCKMKWWMTMTLLEDISIKDLKKQFMDMYDIYNPCHSKTQFLAHTKTKFGMQKYLQIVDNYPSRKTWAKLRGSASCLAIETGRYKQPPIEASQRHCPLCHDIGLLDVEDEQHFLSRCPLLQQTRKVLSDVLPDINGETISATTEKNKLSTILSTIHKIYTLRAHTKPNQTNHTMEQMAIDFVLNTWGYKSASSEPDYPASMLHFITPPPLLNHLNVP